MATAHRNVHSFQWQAKRIAVFDFASMKVVLLTSRFVASRDDDRMMIPFLLYSKRDAFETVTRPRPLENMISTKKNKSNSNDTGPIEESNNAFK